MYVQPFQDSARKWRFRVRAKNHRILAHSEAYSSFSKCWNAVSLFHKRGIGVDFRHVDDYLRRRRSRKGCKS